MSNIHIANLRKDYRLRSLTENDIESNPISQFSKWWDEAIEAEVDEANAMTLATVTKEGKPNARIVLLKGFNEEGFVFYTNYRSRKAVELDLNPFACIVFFWRELERQVRIEGMVKMVSPEASDEYFLQRPVASRIGAWSSPQSEVIQNRDILLNNVRKYEEQFQDGNIPRPPHWGGYLIIPDIVEFWQGRSNRLHDRIRYSAISDKWDIERLAP